MTPPVFIVVCNNTNVSKLVFDYIAGWEKPIGEQTVVQAGQLPIFRNDDGDGGWLQRPNTILVDSQQLESGEAMSDDFKKIAAREIDEFKAEYRVRFPGRDAESLTDEDLLREVMNTVGKAGKLGEQVKCVVSVSMLTEGWDAQTVTHILGVRAFGTQLLCEQVVGRGLRRMSYAANAERPVRAANTPRSTACPSPSSRRRGSNPKPKPGPMPTRVRALESRIACEITFPRLLGYRYDIAGERLTATFTAESHLALSTADIPTRTENAPIVGESSIHTLDDLKRRRPNEVAFLLAKLVLEKYFRDDDGNDKPWLFPQLLAITKRWLAECVTLKDHTFPQLLLLIEFAHDAADRIYKAIVAASRRRPPGRASSRSCAPTTRSAPPATWTSTPTRPVYATRAGQVPHLPRGRRHRLLGAEDGPGAGRDARGRALRQEPQPGLHHPLHAERRGTPVHPGLHRLPGRRPRPGRPA